MGIRNRTISLLVAIAVAGSSVLTAKAAPAPSKPLANRNVTPGLANAVRLGRADPAQTVTVTVSLALRNQAALDRVIAGVSDPKSQSYGRYLQPAQFVALYGPTTAQVEHVVGYLRGQGLTITSVSANHTLVHASGPARRVESAFGVNIWNWHDRTQNRNFFGNDTQPVLPASLATTVVGVAGLNNHYQARRIGLASFARAQPRAPGSGPAGGYTPDELKSAYDITPLAALGYRGGGQPLGLFELDAFNPANIATYDSHYGLATLPTTVVPLPHAAGTPGLNQIEVELDIEVMHAIAPSSPITVWEGPNSDQGVIDTYNAMVMSDSTPSNSTSWGLCEPSTTASLMVQLDTIFKQAAAQGQSFFAASGDSGAYDCPGGYPTQLSVDNPASDPYVTAVGGTTLLLNGSGGYGSETAWNWASHSPPLGGGGGLSQQFSRPAWQVGPGVANSYSTQARQVPDVALDGDPRTGYSIYTTSGTTTSWFVIGGTSASAPAWAAFAAIVNQYRVNAGGRARALGFANPALYQLGSVSSPYAAFHDVTSGDNLYYMATAGWDYATGWGSFDAYNLVRDVTVPSLPPPLAQTPVRSRDLPPSPPPR
jgi:kumamolisin